LKLKRPLAKTIVGMQSLPFYAGMRKILGSEIQIQEASPSDWRQVHAILNPGSSEPPPPPGAHCTNFVAKHRGKVIGHVQLVTLKEGLSMPAGLWLFSLGVRLKYRRMSVGEQLTLRVKQVALGRGAPELYLLVYEDNLPAVRLYHKLGFERRIFPMLEEELEKEKTTSGRRRIVMAAPLQNSFESDFS